MRKILFNFYGDLLFIICSLSCIPPRISFDLWWIPYFGIFLSAFMFLLTLCFVMKYKIFGICEIYNLLSPFFSSAFVLRFHFLSFYTNIFPMIETTFTIIHLLYLLIGLARTIHYLKNKQIDEYPILENDPLNEKNNTNNDSAN